MAKSTHRDTLGPGRELAVLATLRQTTARDIATRTGMAEWRVSRILAGVARPTADELRVLRLALFYEEDAPHLSTTAVESTSTDENAGANETPSAD